MNEIIYAGKHLITFSVTRHAHSSWEFIYCTSGSGRLSFDGGVIPYQAGHLVLIPPFVYHQNESETGFTNIHLNMRDPALNLRRPAVIHDDGNHFILDAFTAAFYYFGSSPGKQTLVLSAYANLIVNIDNDGVAKVIGATFEYREGSGVVAKNLIKIGKDEEADKESDTIAFVCDYYNYDGSFEDTHILGDPITVTDQLYLGDVSISDYTLVSSYELKDIYQQSYWTAPME